MNEQTQKDKTMTKHKATQEQTNKSIHKQIARAQSNQIRNHLEASRQQLHVLHELLRLLRRRP